MRYPVTPVLSVEVVQTRSIWEGETAVAERLVGAVGVWISEDCWVLNVAVTETASFKITAHVPVPEHPPPDQPANIEPGLAVAVRTTDGPELNEAEQVKPQLIPAGLLETTPLPVPLFVIESMYVPGELLPVPRS